MIPREILRQVRRIEISTRGLVNEVFSGEYHSVFKGRGMNFAEVREYQYGDDIRNIDWNVTARAGSPFVKVFEEERELTVMLVVDVSASGDFGTRERLKARSGVEICALLAFSAIKNNDKVGLVIFSDRIEKFVPPRKGRRHVLRVLRELLYHEPKGRGTDVKAALEYLTHIQRKRAVVFLVSDFRDEGFEKALSVAGRRHDLIAVRPRGPARSRATSDRASRPGGPRVGRACHGELVEPGVPGRLRPRESAPGRAAGSSPEAEQGRHDRHPHGPSRTCAP